MKRIFSVAFLCCTMAYMGSCKDATVASGDPEPMGQAAHIKETIPVDEFEKKLAETPGAQLVDVRTSGEFEEGHLKNAVNMNVNREDYKEIFGTLDKSKPVFVYCLSGGRSANAARIMEKMGFTTIYNMEGGIMRWNNAGKPVVTGNAAPRDPGMTLDQYNKMVTSPKYVLVDFNAPWCEPCKKMLPMLESLAGKKQDKMTLVKVNADDNKDLLKQKGIGGIPYLELYKDGKLVWKHDGFIEEKQLLDETKL